MYIEKHICKDCGKEKTNCQGEGWTCLNEKCPQYSFITTVSTMNSPEEITKDALSYFKKQK
jgi:hypothetical protein